MLVNTNETQLLTAAQRGDLVTVKYLVSKGTSVKATCPKCGATVVGHAASSGRSEVVEYLLAHGADINGGRHTALHRAVERGDAALAQMLLERGANPNTRCPQCGATPLSAAAARRRPDLVDLLTRHGASRGEQPAPTRRPLAPSA